jgi:purine-binding chemotaxis protein CheW
MTTFLTFEVSARRFGLSADALREVTRAVAIAPLPKAPRIIEGIINFRGTLIPVLDIRQRFGLPSTPVLPGQHFIVAQAGERLVVLRVDRALDIVAVDADSLIPVSAVAPGTQHVSGLARLPDGVLVIHDLERFLSLEEDRQLERAGRGTPADQARAGSGQE